MYVPSPLLHKNVVTTSEAITPSTCVVCFNHPLMISIEVLVFFHSQLILHNKISSFFVLVYMTKILKPMPINVIRKKVKSPYLYSNF
jgi:hypothetical protein